MKYLKSGDIVSFNSNNYATDIWPHMQLVVKNYGNGYLDIFNGHTVTVREEECILLKPWEQDD
jgi:hypothetical protein